MLDPCPWIPAFAGMTDFERVTSLGINLLRDLPDARLGEVSETIVAAPGLRIERIVSLGQRSPPGFWYDQAETEFVVLLAGAAGLRFADEAETRELRPGDHLTIA